MPNISEGRDRAALAAIGAAFGPGLIHASDDRDHNRAVFTLEGGPGALAQAVTAGAREAIARLDITTHEGVHPRVGAIDVAPIVYLDPAERGAAVAEALVLADELGALGLPVFLYGALAGGRTRAELRKGGPQALIRRTAPDFGPAALHPTAGAVLVAARPPLAAFNVELAPPATLADAKRIAAAIRDPALPGVRALGLQLTGAVQVSTNVEDLDRVDARRRGRRRRPPRHGRPAPSWWRRRRGPRSPASRPASRCAGRPCWGDGSSTLPAAMAQTKRKRRTKHRGNAAGVVESRGRTGRRPTDEEQKAARMSARERRVNKPPSWQGAFMKAGLMAALLFLFTRIGLFGSNAPISQSIAISLMALVIYTPLAYATDKWVYTRAQKRALQKP